MSVCMVPVACRVEVDRVTEIPSGAALRFTNGSSLSFETDAEVNAMIAALGGVKVVLARRDARLATAGLGA